MKLIPLLAAFIMGALPAQEVPPGKEPAKEIKAEGPLEERAFRIFDLVGQFPEVIATIKDQESLAAAETKLSAVTKKLDAEGKELDQLPKAPNEDRKKLAAKMEQKAIAMEKKMTGISRAVQKMDPELRTKTFAILSKFSAKMEELGPKIDKHFSPDKAQEEKAE